MKRKTGHAPHWDTGGSGPPIYEGEPQNPKPPEADDDRESSEPQDEPESRGERQQQVPRNRQINEPRRNR